MSAQKKAVFQKGAAGGKAIYSSQESDGTKTAREVLARAKTLEIDPVTGERRLVMLKPPPLRLKERTRRVSVFP